MKTNESRVVTIMALLTISDMANELRCTKKTIYQLLKFDGLDKYVSRIGGRLVTTVDKLQQYLDDRLITQ